MLVYLCLSQSILDYLCHFRPNLVHLCVSLYILLYLRAILGFLGLFELSWAISGYLRYLRLSQAISGYLGCSQAILGVLRLSWAIMGNNDYLWLTLSSIRVQEEAAASKLLLFETFPYFFFIYH